MLFLLVVLKMPLDGSVDDVVVDTVVVVATGATMLQVLVCRCCRACRDAGTSTRSFRGR